MEYTIDKNMWRGFLGQMDLMHTLNGGMSMTSLDVAENENDITITISAPSVKPEAYQVFVDHTKLVVYSTYKQQSTQGETGIPMYFKTFDIPYFVDGANIKATFEEGKLVVIMPFSESKQTLQRKIDIELS
ncbi:Hsp20 family protein [Rhodocytophaga rosea]|uniref:Hsp20 family protein n=1 Tax=Rhodocytophaga rosea TaxID=2704465 RepID=A0A6C0GCP5_9BACT|nr:Hsp20/alpha crystallin family protein [Rhodocytophaga rosea]QHT65741.1 Hsp20 family protein [Rhodocytophaga rosea]